MTQPYPPSYLPFIQEKALHHQYDHIRRFYNKQEDHWFLQIPYHYMNEAAMSRVIRDSIQAILIVYENVREMKAFDGLVSSAVLLPEELTGPYERPLGNSL